jgi:hypothetical protein
VVGNQGYSSVPTHTSTGWHVRAHIEVMTEKKTPKPMTMA